MEILFKIIGALGLVFIIIGVLSRNEKIEDSFYIAGGICLGAYSIYIKDIIFIILQIIFIVATTYELIKIQNGQNN